MRTPEVLAAAVEVFLAAGDVERARIGERSSSPSWRHDPTPPMLRAAAALATGSVLLGTGRRRQPPSPRSSRRATARAELDLRYETARARIAIATACFGPSATTTPPTPSSTPPSVELDELGADVELERARGLQRRSDEAVDSLTARECEVLRLVAGGGTNREVAASLRISEHTVARHLQNIFTKLGLSSRTAATAYAYEHGLIGARGQN